MSKKLEEIEGRLIVFFVMSALVSGLTIGYWWGSLNHHTPECQKAIRCCQFMGIDLREFRWETDETGKIVQVSP